MYTHTVPPRGGGGVVLLGSDKGLRKRTCQLSRGPLLLPACAPPRLRIPGAATRAAVYELTLGSDALPVVGRRRRRRWSFTPGKPCLRGTEVGSDGKGSG